MTVVEDVRFDFLDTHASPPYTVQPEQATSPAHTAAAFLIYECQFGQNEKGEPVQHPGNLLTIESFDCTVLVAPRPIHSEMLGIQGTCKILDHSTGMKRELFTGLHVSFYDTDGKPRETVFRQLILNSDVQ